MNLSLTPQQIGAWFRKLTAIATAVLAAIPQDQLTGNERTVLGIISAALFAVWHYTADPSTGNPTPPPTPPAPHV
jgi:hypothetical protein